ncbi:dTDP-4-dehydrorhamnose 3,5-epimerase [Streptomyces sp. ADI96-02]|uniref:dTDP-4-dehydrorhamnose 3,5-epimerase family protein n=1 Tax=Streptomyces sp. ADI96-02 TaxID=1522760 RepID=UPI000F558320|nr:dTDP-4-dehydrorhamnose 3,5-epimerase family protein [Streptomyces sp. ADI96-02]RPK56945.1 dTDP-4-dehydrorhamnose 3,5-epimerase [Streptomyces sp. ADI96-02]
MRVRELAVGGALEFTPEIFPDERGRFLSPFQQPAFAEARGHPLFPVEQISYSVSRRGVVRGVHYTATPAGCAKYVFCSRGQVLDAVVDLRVGSPTFGSWDTVVLDEEECRALYLPVGVGHLFVALQDHATMHYTLSRSYEPSRERAVSPLDRDLALPLDDREAMVLSERDRAAPTLAEARERGLLPDYAVCREQDVRLAAAAGARR